MNVGEVRQCTDPPGDWEKFILKERIYGGVNSNSGAKIWWWVCVGARGEEKTMSELWIENYTREVI